jgi:hypothetical protein
MQKIELGRHGATIEQCREGHAAGSSMHRDQLPESGRIRVDDSLRERLLRSRMHSPKGKDGHAEQGESSHSVGHGDPPVIEMTRSSGTRSEM